MISIKLPTQTELALDFLCVLYTVAESCSCETAMWVAPPLEEISMRSRVKTGLAFGIHSSTAEEKTSSIQAKLALQSEPCTAPLRFQFSVVFIVILYGANFYL